MKIYIKTMETKRKIRYYILTLILLILISCDFDVSKETLPYECYTCEVDIYSLTLPRIAYSEVICHTSQKEIDKYCFDNNYLKSNGEFKMTFCWKNN